MNPVILYDNRFDDGTPTATDTADGYSPLNIRDGRPYTYHKFAALGTKYITVDCGTAKSADALGIYKHNLGTAAATVSVESSATGAWAGEQVERLAGFVPANDKGIIKLFTSASARYWRIKIVTASIAAMFAEVKLSVRLLWPYPPDTPFIPQHKSVKAESVDSKTGQPLGAVVYYKPLKVDAKFSMLLRSWVDTNYAPFYDNHASLKKFFFWAWDLDVYPNMVHFLRLSGDATDALPMTYSQFYDAVTLAMEGMQE